MFKIRLRDVQTSIDDGDDVMTTLPTTNAAYAGDIAPDEDSETDDEETKAAALADNATLEHNYWDKVFGEADSPIEWLLSWSSSKRFWAPFLPAGPDGAQKKTIAIGTGNSKFPIEIIADGLCPGGIVCSDFSPIVVKKMSSTCAEGKVSFTVEDARKLSYSSNSIDVCIDKSLMDCMFYAKDRDLSLKSMTSEIHRVLQDGHGTALFMTQRNPAVVEPYFSRFERVEYIPIAALMNEDGNVVPGCPACLEDVFDDYYDNTEFYDLLFLYICVKGTKGPPKIVPYHNMKLFEFPPVEGAAKLVSKRGRTDIDSGAGDGSTRKRTKHESDGEKSVTSPHQSSAATTANNQA